MRWDGMGWDGMGEKKRERRQGAIGYEVVDVA